LAPDDLRRVHQTLLMVGDAYLALLKMIGDAIVVQELSQHEKIGHILYSKLPGAQGFHHQVLLGDKTLENWFSQNPFPTNAFINELANSRFVDKEAPAQSALLQAMRFGGPMYGVFSESERASIQHWIEALSRTPGPQAHDDRQSATRTIQRFPSPALSGEFPETQPYRQASQRQMFHYLLNVQQHPYCLPTAQRSLRREINSTRTRINRTWFLPRLLRGFVYTPQAFRQRLDMIFTRQVDPRRAYPRAPLLSKEQCRWLIRQIAPAALVDGCWLQNAVDLGLLSRPIASRLARIYRDELGAGSLAQNHTRLYCNLLRDMDIDMPPVHTEDFIHQEPLLDTAFDMPLLFLRISIFSREYIPELLGLNLAFELSGLGKDYQAMIDELRYWQADPYFFMLHQSIDNYASGHAALAAEAIARYLDETESIGGSQALQAQWTRVWCGYVLFNLSLRTFFRTVFIRLLPGLSARWLQRTIAVRR
jgi:hypothetical protein